MNQIFRTYGDAVQFLWNHNLFNPSHECELNTPHIGHVHIFNGIPFITPPIIIPSISTACDLYSYLPNYAACLMKVYSLFHNATHRHVPTATGLRYGHILRQTMLGITQRQALLERQQLPCPQNWSNNYEREMRGYDSEDFETRSAYESIGITAHFWPNGRWAQTPTDGPMTPLQQ